MYEILLICVWKNNMNVKGSYYDIIFWYDFFNLLLRYVWLGYVFVISKIIKILGIWSMLL